MGQANPNYREHESLCYCKSKSTNRVSYALDQTSSRNIRRKPESIYTPDYSETSLKATSEFSLLVVNPLCKLIQKVSLRISSAASNNYCATRQPMRFHCMQLIPSLQQRKQQVAWIPKICARLLRPCRNESKSISLTYLIQREISALDIGSQNLCTENTFWSFLGRKVKSLLRQCGRHVKTSLENSQPPGKAWLVDAMLIPASLFSRLKR